MPPLMIEKSLKCLLILICRRFRGGPVKGFMGGASLETFSGEAQLKNHPVYIFSRLVHKNISLKFQERRAVLNDIVTNVFMNQYK